MAAASWLQSVFISRAFCASWSSCRVNWPALLPEGLQQMLQWRRRWRLPSHQLPLLVGHLSPEPRDRSPADRGGHEVSDHYGGVWNLFLVRVDLTQAWWCTFIEWPSRRRFILSFILSYHNMYSEDDSNGPITALLGQPPSLFTASHKLSDQKLFVTIFREFFWFWNFSSSLSNIWVKILKNRFCSKVSVTVWSENNSRC